VSQTESSATIQLFCLPYAGASARIYSRWSRLLPRWIEVCPLELPGHGRLLGEALETDVAVIARRLLPQLESALSLPYAFFGHSMGAVVAFELALACQGRLAPPLALFASGADAPSRRDRARYALLSSDGELMLELERLQGTPPEVLGSSELMALALPILRADFAACAAYQSDATRQLRCAIHVLGGSEDATSLESLATWREHGHGDFSLNMFPGGHFFVHELEREVLQLLESRLERLLSESRPPLAGKAVSRRVSVPRANDAERASTLGVPE
jgi:surfactin synthase thioesterase subunit